MDSPDIGDMGFAQCLCQTSPKQNIIGYTLDSRLIYGINPIGALSIPMGSIHAQKTNGIDPIGVLRASMGLIPYMCSGHLWDQSHRCTQSTYGINPIGMLRAPMGVI